MSLESDNDKNPLATISDSDLLAECQRRILKRGGLYLKDRKSINGSEMLRGAYGLHFFSYHMAVDDPDFPPHP